MTMRIRLAIVLCVVALPVCALAQGTSAPQGDLELKTTKQTPVVRPQTTPGQAAKDVE